MRTPPACPRPKAWARRGAVIHLAVGVPRQPPEHRPKDRRGAAVPPPSVGAAASRPASGAPRGHPETRDDPHLPALVRHPPARIGHRHSNPSGATRPPKPQDDHDLHPRCKKRPPGSDEPSGLPVALPVMRQPKASAKTRCRDPDWSNTRRLIGDLASDRARCRCPKRSLKINDSE